jgi:hypothetical protein
MGKVRRLVFFALLIIGMAGLVGCGQVADDQGEKPWTEPEPWERNIGIGPLDQEPL